MSAAKITTFLLIASLALTSQVFGGDKEAAASQHKGFDSGMALPSLNLATIKVVYYNNLGEPAAPTVSAAAPETCTLSSNSGFLQGSRALGLYNSPANCFSLTFTKPEPELKPLVVQNGPLALPTIVVHNFPQSIQKEFRQPAFPASRPQSPLPQVFVWLGVVSFFVGKLLNRGAARPAKPTLGSDSLNRLAILRC
jgi:hypothetical protein